MKVVSEVRGLMMITAKWAREQTEEYKIKIIRDEIESEIRKAVSKGREKITITGNIPACIISELESNGFTISNGLIKW